MGDDNASQSINEARLWISTADRLPIAVETYLPGGEVAVSYRFTRFLNEAVASPSFFSIRDTSPKDGIRRRLFRW